MYDFAALYQKYHDELYGLCRRMRRHYHLMLRRGFRATFGDIEAEVLYLLVRERRPDVVLEISPDCGWSTNYLLAALTANQKGTLHSFEIATQLQGKPVEQAIRDNLHPDWDQQRLILHVGDARETAPTVGSRIDFLFLDSCHEAFFAKWYAESLFPRVQGITFIQDIMFEDEQEPSTESEFLWSWLEKSTPPVTLVGAVESSLAESGLRREFPERRGLRSNSIFFELPITCREPLPALAVAPSQLLGQAETALAAGRHEEADRLLNHAVSLLLERKNQVHRHRHLLRAALAYQRLGEHGEADRCLQRALGLALQADKFQRSKALRELWKRYLKQGDWTRAGLAFGFSMLQPRKAPFRRAA